VRGYWLPPSYEAAISGNVCVNYIPVYQVHNGLSPAGPGGETEQNCESYVYWTVHHVDS
jgi:hypothetical protein